MVPPQIPFEQASEQQSCGLLHGRPSAEQDARHARLGPVAAGSHRPLQQEPLDVHAVPLTRHTTGTVQTLPMQKPEQHSSPRVQEALASKHAPASTTSTEASRSETSATASGPVPRASCSMLTSRPLSCIETSLPMPVSVPLSRTAPSLRPAASTSVPPASGAASLPGAPALASSTGAASGAAPPDPLLGPPRGSNSPTFRSDEHRGRRVAANRAMRIETTRPRARRSLFRLLSDLRTRNPDAVSPLQRGRRRNRARRCARDRRLDAAPVDG